MPYIGNQPYQGVIDSGNIVDGSIQTGDLANSAVTTAKIADSNITTTKIADTGVTVAKLNSDVTQLIAQGGGPKITGVAITNSSWTAIDDTAVDTAGGYVKLIGTNFVTGCSVVVGTTSATAVTFTSSTELRVQLPAQAAGTYILYVTNPDGGTAIRVNAVTYSATPSWVTSSTLPQQDDGVAISIQLSATSATTYALQAGSTLPSGLTLTSGGLLSGTVSGLASDTSYSFTVVATDAELQDSPRAFTVNIAATDTYFNLTTLLINGDTAPNVLTDASSNNFNLIAYGDARASNFTPYGTGWSNYFDGSGDYIVANNPSIGTGDFAIESWAYFLTVTGDTNYRAIYSNYGSGGAQPFIFGLYTNTTPYFQFFDGVTGNNGVTPLVANTWYHFLATRRSGVLKLFLNGVLEYTGANTVNIGAGTARIGMVPSASQTGYMNGYISNLRVCIGFVPTDYHTTSTTIGASIFTVPNSNLSNVSQGAAGVQLLACQSNRFIDNSTNNTALVRNGDVAVRSFNPFNIISTGTAGSIYFDGTDDYVTVGTTASNAFAFSGDFTIEAWFYKPGNGSDTYEMLLSIGDGNGVNGFFLELDDTRSLAPRLYMNNGALVLDGYVTSKINDAQWHHIACVRSGSNCAMFYDGTRVATSTSSASLVSSASALYIGRASNSSVNDFYGYVSDVRIINGTAAYNPTLTTITVPTQPLTAVANTQLLTLQYKQPNNNHSFQDSSTNNHLITRNGNTTQGTFSPFSPVGWSGYFNGSTDSMVIASGSQTYDFNSWYLSTTASGSRVGTIEAWIYLQSHSSPTTNYTHRCILGRGGTFLNFGVRPNGALRFYYFNGTTDQTWFESSANAIQLNTWHHVAAVLYSNDTCKLFVDGVPNSGNRITTTGGDSGSTTFNGNEGTRTDAEATNHYIGRETSGPSTSRWHGYIANLRIVSGQSLYTTNFTPSISPLTTTSQGVSGTNCKLLTLHTNRFKDDGPNNRTFTLEGTPSIQAYSPFKPTAAYSPVTHGGSAYFDGSLDYLSLAENALWRFGTRDFTIEAWVWLDNTNATQTLAFHWNGTSGGTVIGSTAITSYSWNHIAVTRSGTTLRFWINGAEDSGGIKTVSATIYNNADPLYIGRGADHTTVAGRDMFHCGELSGTQPKWYFYLAGGGNGDFKGYMTGINISQSVKYTTSFVPALPTSTNNTSLLLNFTDAAARDSTGRLVLETVNDSKVSTVQKKYGTGAMYFDGTGDGIVCPNPTLFNFGSGDLTIECWFNYNSGTTNYGLFTTRLNAGQYAPVQIQLETGNVLKAYASTSGSSWAVNITSSTSPVAGTWYHVALVRSGTTFTLYLNGYNVGTTTGISGALATSTLYGGVIGVQSADLTNPMNGYIDDFRITRYARYTGSSTSTPNFTPPAQTFKLR